MLSRKLRLEWLLDFYGNLLTERQRLVLELHWDEDLSLGEVAENLAVSRQAVYYAVKSAERALERYEEKLKLVEQFQKRHRGMADVLTRLEALEQHIQPSSLRSELRRIRDTLHGLSEL